MRLTLEEIDRLVRDSNPVPDVGVLAPVELATLAADLQRSSAMPTATEVELNVDSPPPTSRRWTHLAVAAVAVAIVAGVIAIAVRNDPDDTAPAATTTPLTTAPTTTPSSQPSASAARATITPTGAGPGSQLTYEPVAGWEPIDGATDLWGIHATTQPDGVAIIYTYIGDVYDKRCGPDDSLLHPGPSVDDLVTALVIAWGPYASAPEDATLGGYSGKHIVLTVPTHGADCPIVNMNGWREWGQTDSGPARWFQAEGQVQEIWVLDVAGSRQVIGASFLPSTPASVRAEEHTILDSIRIEPAGVTLRPPNRTSAIEVTLPGGWESGDASVSAPSGNASLAVWDRPNLFIDPCESMTQGGPDRPEPTVAWIVSVTDWWGRSSGPGDEIPPIATSPSSQTVGGKDATYFEVRSPSNLDLSQCDGGDFRLWSDPSGQSKLQVPGQVDRVWVFEGSDQIPVIVDASYTADASPEELAQLQQAIDSITVS